MTNIVNYQKLMYAAMRNIIKDALTIIAQSESFSNVHVAISFLTYYKGVILPDYVKNNYPEEITIILQHQFRNLQILDNSMSVILSFKGKEETITIPYHSIIKYVDVDQSFALDLKQYAGTEHEENNTENNHKNKQDNIIFIDTFLKK